MVPQSQKRKTRNSSRSNLIISLVFHGALVFIVLYFAARGGILGEKAKSFVVTMEKKPPPPPPAKKEPDKVPDNTPKLMPAMTTAPKVAPSAPTASATVAPPVVAPAAVDVPSLDFAGGRSVISSTDPNTIYKSLIEQALTAQWKRPDMGDKDKDYVAEVEVSVDPSGRLSTSGITKRSGNPTWDGSVEKAIANTTQLSEKPPPNFPRQVIVRFDTTEEDSGPLLP